MRHFAMCAACTQEYEHPADRRFHAQPNACPTCGPRLWCADAGGAELHGDAIEQAAGAIARGAIVALKGLGGFQLCCAADDDAAVRLLRTRKRRPAKPFAVMCPSLNMATSICALTHVEAALLQGVARPIVLVPLRPH